MSDINQYFLKHTTKKQRAEVLRRKTKKIKNLLDEIFEENREIFLEFGRL